MLTHTHTLSESATDLTVTSAELNLLAGLLATAADINKIAGLTVDAAQLNQLDGIGPTVTAANLGTLTNGGNADALHSHSGLGVPSEAQFVANAGDAAFDLGVVPIQANVSINGVIQKNPEHFTIVGTFIVMNEVTELGDNVLIFYW